MKKFYNFAKNEIQESLFLQVMMIQKPDFYVINIIVPKAKSQKIQ